MNIEEKIRSLLEEVDQKTPAQLSYPGATNPQDPAPYMGVPYEVVEYDRPGVTGAEQIQQVQYPGQPQQDPEPLPAEYMEIDPYMPASDIVPNAEKESYPIGTGADDVTAPQDPAATQEEDEYSKDIKPAQHPAPFVAESTINEAYSVHRPRKGISARHEGPVVVLDKTTITAVEKKLGLEKGALATKDGRYSETMLVKGKDGKLHTVYANGDQARIRSYGHDDKESTESLKKHLNEAAEAEPTPQEDPLEQAVEAVQAGNDINQVSKATGIPVEQIQAALDAATPANSPKATVSTAPVSEAYGINEDPAQYAKSPKHFAQLTKQSGFLDDNNPPVAVRYLGKNTGGDHTYGLVYHDSDNPDKYLHTSFYAKHDKQGKLVGDWGGSPHDEGDEDDMLDILHSRKAYGINEATLRQDVANIISEEDANLSEAFKEKAEALFEAAVVSRVNAEVMRLEEAYTQKLDEQRKHLEEQFATAANQFAEQQSTRLTQYINYLGEQWIKQNKVAVENGIRAELTESFMKGLSTLFEQHYINKPESDYDLVAEQRDQIESLKSALNEATQKVESLDEETTSLKRKLIIDRIAESLADTEAARLHALCEGIEYDSDELFESKVQLVKTNFFKKVPKHTPQELLEETVHATQPQVEPEQKPAQITDPSITAAIQALNSFKRF